MDFCNLTGLKALVTGGSRGIGRAVAEKLISAGAEVTIVGTNPEKTAEIAAQIGAKGVGVNLSDIRSIDGLIEQVGPVDILVNNAGITRDGMFMRQKIEDWESVLNVNLHAAVKLAHGVLPAMSKKGFGRIINISSVVAHRGNVGQTNYITSKAAITGFTKALAAEMARKGVTVNSVAPGFIETDMTKDIPEKVTESLMAQIPAKRYGQPDEIASAVLFLASKEAGYITGSTTHVNGGMYM